jgi:proline iminopeptidase
VDRLAVGNGNTLHVEQVGRSDGTPLLLLHGGPGSGWSERARATIDPERQRGVLFDQRAAGRSRPHASEPGVHWDSIDLDHHLADIEAIREHLGIDRWAVFGASWGSVLGLAYAERYPHRVTAVVVAAVSTGTRRDIEWLTVDAGRFFPEEWAAFRDHVPEHLRHLRLVEAYRQLVMDPDPAVHHPAARAWCDWEDRHVRTVPGAGPDPRYDDPVFRLGFARQVTHCWANDSWLTEDELVANAHRLAGIPGLLVHGRLDVSGPLDAPWRLHHAWPGSELIVVDDEGHGGPTMQTTWRRLVRAL